MIFDVEIVLRERSAAVTERIVHEGSEPADWDERDVERVLKAMLLAIDRLRNPQSDHHHVALRGFSWIVEPAQGGVVIAIEIPSGAAVAGPFDVPQQRLDALIGRVLTTRPPAKPVVH
ncbi:MAG: hypothetical protein A3H96_21835 [Acidobacteria bacterium RIFCSPLOWO2_02_FULL_67_36]|nr:MAG: hypothetical protein A3H96_21835 [Acidobacteria bacterium RIFCSPLOWO2_02_FULL_67_36]OFW19836.1 MAG: hypothetical protein A3G21_09430 [Acidobacteria bacterium RIFCSPLOWO2_12_FULL_66_21]